MTNGADNSDYDPIIPAVDDLMDFAPDFESAPGKLLMATEKQQGSESVHDASGAEEHHSTAPVAPVTTVPVHAKVVRKCTGKERSSTACQIAVRDFLAQLAAHTVPELPQVVLLTSVGATPRGAEAVELIAHEFYRRGEKVLVVDANLGEQRLTRIHESLGCPGVCDILAGCCDAAGTVRTTHTPGIQLVPSGDDVLGISREPALLSENSLIQALHAWQSEFDRILIDGGSSDGALLEALGRNCQVTVLVVPFGPTETTRIRQAAMQLAEYKARLAGCLLTDFPATV
jgi:hypothetical protein